ncbi:hypothetical protein LC087_18280 [Bacillus carboniphilus]|uniref:Tsi6 domain-containing protein n=1 Tax=Bacillus carboniphilus TaxID=86663 RepID=A0ABY9JVV7_9BACI|nr:hypothetical protein [Bacillus carboniphilus]WLR42602.1 hypothetical protein LC087_18280 [Bacillus carboniphilus]
MDLKQQLISQVTVVLAKLERDYFNEIYRSGLINLIYKRYKNTLEILENNGDVKGIFISGGVRAYLDRYSDYENPLLEEMHKAEKLYEKLRSV